MFIMAVGHSDDPDTSEAIVELLEQCQEQLEGHEPQAGVLFAALDFEYQELLDGILAVYPNLELVGCSTAGELSSQLGYQQDSISLTLFYSNEVEFQAAVGRNLSQGPIATTKATFQALKEQSEQTASLCLVFPDAINGIHCEVVEALVEAAGEIPVVGGVAGGNPETLTTYQFFKNEVLQDSVPMLMMSGNLKVAHGFASGWNPLGKTGEITKVRRNIISEIDHQPALKFYEHYLSTFAPDNAYPLAIFPPNEDRYLLRASFEHDEQTGQLVVGGYVPADSTVQITAAEREDIITATQQSYEDAKATYPGNSPAGALFFSCAWRNWVLGTQTSEEFDCLHAEIPSSGFYTFGEITPLRAGGPTFSHNTTFVTLLIGTE